MRYGLVFILVLLWSINSASMQESTLATYYSAPLKINQLDPFNNEVALYTINAFFKDKAIGYIKYELNSITRIGIIIALNVEKEFRNKHIGFNLFKKAIQEMTSTCTQVEWTVLPQAPDVPLDTLQAIYQKMVEKLGTNFILKTGEPYGYPVPRVVMSLKLVS